MWTLRQRAGDGPQTKNTKNYQRTTEARRETWNSQQKELTMLTPRSQTFGFQNRDNKILLLKHTV